MVRGHRGWLDEGLKGSNAALFSSPVTGHDGDIRVRPGCGEGCKGFTLVVSFWLVIATFGPENLSKNELLNLQK